MGGGGGCLEPPKTGVGYGKRAQLTAPFVSFFFEHQKWSIFSSPNPWQMMAFLNPLDALIPKISFSFFCRIFGPGHLRGPGGQSR